MPDPSDWPFEAEVPPAKLRTDVALCRHQEIAEAENRFRERQNRDHGRSEHTAVVDNEVGRVCEDMEPQGEHASEAEINRYHCVGDDGSSIIIVEQQYFLEVRGAGGTRIRPGARRFALTSGEAARRIDEDTFEAIQTGELIRTRATKV